METKNWDERKRAKKRNEIFFSLISCMMISYKIEDKESEDVQKKNLEPRR